MNGWMDVSGCLFGMVGGWMDVIWCGWMYGWVGLWTLWMDVIWCGWVGGCRTNMDGWAANAMHVTSHMVMLSHWDLYVRTNLRCISERNQYDLWPRPSCHFSEYMTSIVGLAVRASAWWPRGVVISRIYHQWKWNCNVLDMTAANKNPSLNPTRNFHHPRWALGLQ